MKFSCKQHIFHEALQTVSKAVSSNNTLPVLDNILLKVEGSVLHLTATDLETSIATYIEVKVQEEGSITIPAKLLVQYVSLLPPKSDIDVELESGNALSLTSPNSKTKIKGISAEEFPIIPPVEEYYALQIPGKKLLRGINQVLFSTSNNTTRPILAGVFFTIIDEELYLVSTDSFRLSEKHLPLGKLDDTHKLKMIVPSKTLHEVLRVFAKEGGDDEVLKVRIAKNQILFEQGHTKLTSRLIEGEFPDYTQIIPKEQKTTCDISKEEFLLALKRINLFAKENNFNVKFKVVPAEQKIHITTDTLEIGEEEANIDTINAKGDELEIALNAQYIIDVLNTIEQDHITMKCVDALKPAVFIPQDGRKEEEQDYLHLIMPLKLT